MNNYTFASNNKKHGRCSFCQCDGLLTYHDMLEEYLCYDCQSEVDEADEVVVISPLELPPPDLRQTLATIAAHNRRIAALPDGRPCDDPHCLDGWCENCGRYMAVRVEKRSGK